MIRSGRWCVLVFACLASTSAYSLNHASFAGEFDGSEPTATGVIDQRFDCDNPVSDYRYQSFGRFRVETSGDYYIADPGHRFGVDVATAIYLDTFDPNEIGESLVGGHNQGGSVFLNQGSEYFMVVQESCEHQTGPFHVTLRGPGNVIGVGFDVLEEHTFGSFDGNLPAADLGLGALPYQVSDPIQFSTGTHTFSDAGALYQSDMVLHVYQGVFDPENPDHNRLAMLDDLGEVLLESGVSYTLVAQAAGPGSDMGLYAYILINRATGISINAGLNDAWVSDNAPFQGMFLTVFEDIGALFLAWFTFDSEPPAGDDLAAFGAHDQRWVTAVGGWEGNTATLTVELTSGGVFNQSEPEAAQMPQYGSITIEFLSCNEARVSYTFPDPALSGSFPIHRVLDSNVVYCEAAQ